MRIIVVGAEGTLGKAVVKELSLHHEVIKVGRSKGDIICDMTSQASIHEMYKKAGKVDAVAVTAGKVHFDSFADMNYDKYHIGIHNKLLGQVSMVLIGSQYIKDGGSFSLISGILAHDFIPKGSSAAMVNGAVESFVQAVSMEMPRGIRINAICPTLVQESEEKLGSFFPGFDTVPAKKVGLAYRKSIEGLRTGHIFKVVH